MTPWREALVIGVIFSLFFYHCTGWSAGGLITPGYLVLYLRDWRGSLVLAGVVLATWGLGRWAGTWLPLWGRRRWAFCVATGVVLRAVWDATLGLGPPMPSLAWEGLGLVVPGLVASELLRQGAWPTFGGLVTATAATWWALIALGVM